MCVLRERGGRGRSEKAGLVKKENNTLRSGENYANYSYVNEILAALSETNKPRQIVPLLQSVNKGV